MLKRPIIALYLVVFGLGPLTQELQKLPGIVSHYVHHIGVHDESDLSVIEFLLTHFTERTHHDADHERLPFHGTDCQGPQQIITIDNVAFQTSLPEVPVPAAGEVSVFSPEAPSNSVFQPPRS